MTVSNTYADTVAHMVRALLRSSATFDAMSSGAPEAHHFSCPSCGSNLKVEGPLEGAEECPKCQHLIDLALMATSPEKAERSHVTEPKPPKRDEAQLPLPKLQAHGVKAHQTKLPNEGKTLTPGHDSRGWFCPACSNRLFLMGDTLCRCGAKFDPPIGGEYFSASSVKSLKPVSPRTAASGSNPASGIPPQKSATPTPPPNTPYYPPPQKRSRFAFMAIAGLLIVAIPISLRALNTKNAVNQFNQNGAIQSNFGNATPSPTSPQPMEPETRSPSSVSSRQANTSEDQAATQMAQSMDQLDRDREEERMQEGIRSEIADLDQEIDSLIAEINQVSDRYNLGIYATRDDFTIGTGTPWSPSASASEQNLINSLGARIKADFSKIRELRDQLP